MDRGGAEMRTLELMRALADRGIQFDFATLTNEGGDLDREIRARGGEVHRVGFDASSLSKFWHLLRQGGFHAIHSHVHYVSAIPVAIAALCGVPCRIAHFRSTGDGMPQTLLRRLRNSVLIQLLRMFATHLVGVSRASLESSLPADLCQQERTSVLYSGIDQRPFAQAADRATIREELGIAPDAHLIIHVGRMAPEKNHQHLVNTCIQISKVMPKTRLLLVGRRDPKIEAQLLEATGNSNLLVIAGLREDAAELLQAADLMIFPSLREGLPGAVLEASAAGLPILASRIPGLEELDGKLPGLELISPKTSPEVWARRACQLLSNPHPPAPRRLPACFDAAEAASGFEALYRSANRQDSEFWSEARHV